MAYNKVSIIDTQDFIDYLLAAEDPVVAMADLKLSKDSLEKSASFAQKLILKSLGVTTKQDLHKYLENDKAFEDGIQELLGKIDEKEEFETLEVGANYEENPDLIVVRSLTVSNLLDLVKNFKIKEKELLNLKKEKDLKYFTDKRENHRSQAEKKYESCLKDINKLQEDYRAELWNVVKKIALSLCFLAIAFVLASPVFFPATALAFPVNSLFAASIATVGEVAAGAGWSFATAGAIRGFSWNFSSLPACFLMLSKIKDQLKKNRVDENEKKYEEDLKKADDMYESSSNRSSEKYNRELAEINATISAINAIEDTIKVQVNKSVGIMAHKRGIHILHDKVESQIRKEYHNDDRTEKAHKAEPIKRKTPKAE